jgi:hypothetical protein
VAHMPVGPRKLAAGSTQVSLPRDLIRELASDREESDDALIDRLFGDPPKVLFQLYGDPPRAILVWPLTNQAAAYQEYRDQETEEAKKSGRSKGASTQPRRMGRRR